MEWDRPRDESAPDLAAPEVAVTEGSERIPGEAFPDAR
jgi:hypothetical protein